MSMNTYIFDLSIWHVYLSGCIKVTLMQGYLDNLSSFPAGYFLSCCFSSAGRFCGWFFCFSWFFFSWVFFSAGCIRDRRDHLPPNSLFEYTFHAYFIHALHTYVLFLSTHYIHILLFDCSILHVDLWMYQGYKPLDLSSWAIFSDGRCFQLGAFFSWVHP